MLPSRFNVRCYGIWIHQNRILICRENGGLMEMVKFPGGGLEYGEGLVECLYREFMEETGTSLNHHELLWINDFYQQSAFHQGDQLISVYYLVSASTLPAETKVTEIRDGKEWQIQLEWVPLSQLKPDDMTFPVDQVLVQRLIAGHLSK